MNLASVNIFACLAMLSAIGSASAACATDDPAAVTLLLQRDSAADCWRLSDLVGPRGESLLRAIEEWYKEYGSAL